MAEEQESRVAREGRRRIGDPFVRAVARLPVKVRTKLLIAFVGTSLLLVAVGLLGQLVLGQSNDRVASVGPLQERAVRVQQTPGRRPSTSGMSWRQNVADPTSAPDLAGRARPQIRGTYSLAVDLFAVDAAESDRGAARPRINSGSRRLRRTRRSCDRIEDTADELSSCSWSRSSSRSTSERDHHDRRTRSRSRRCCRCERDAELTRERPPPGRRGAGERDARRDRGSDRPERELLRELPRPVHRRRGGGARPRAAARVRPVVVADRADPEASTLASPRSRRATSRAAWRSRTETSWARWAPTSTG